MHTTRLFNVIVVGGFSLGGCSNEAPGSRPDAEDSGSGGVPGQASSGGSKHADASGNAGAPDTPADSAPRGAGGSSGSRGEASAPSAGGAPDGSADPSDASDGAPPSEAGQSCTCTEPPLIFCDGICCMWMFQEDQPCCDKL